MKEVSIKKLIDIASKNDGSRYYGDINKGYMNINNINELYTKIKMEVCEIIVTIK